MKRRLFLTGPMGFGKSTAIQKALGASLSQCGGFVTLRKRDAQGHAVSFSLVSPDGNLEETFLDFSSGKPEVNLQVFDGLGVSLLKGRVLVLDEIGGIELLCPGFTAALEAVLQSGIPVLGVMKGEGPAGALIEALGLSEEYETSANCLRSWMRDDDDTLLYECGKFDENALHLAECWVKEYLHE